MKELRGTILYTVVIFVAAAVYFFYLSNVYSPGPEKETLLSEVGEFFGEVALWVLIFIYARTVLKLAIGKGAITQRVVPEIYQSTALPVLKRLLNVLNKTHVYVGIAAVAVVILHIALIGLPLEILFFPIVLALVIWQGLFGFFIRWKYSPRELKKFSYLVHAQFITGIMIGIFAYFGHMLVDN